ncbi:TPA: HEAT repeat domain-containing protein [Citrobacter freundii]
MNKKVDVEIIKPLVQQHARDAVFYWQQLNTGRFSPLVTSQKWHHFRRQLNAHIDGLRAAGQEGWDAAFKNYSRWKTDSEAFICWLLALEQDEPSHIRILHNMAPGNSDSSLQGMVEAIAWLPEPQTRLILARWRAESSSDERKLEAWLQAMGSSGIEPQEELFPLLEHENPHIRAVCCELVGKLRLHRYQQAVAEMLTDNDFTVREQAVLALAWLSPRIDIVDELQNLLVFHLKNAPQRGLAAVLAQRKLEYIARITGLCIPQGDRRLETILTAIPGRLRLLILAFHGDPAQLSVLYKAMENESTARLAFWAAGFISGLDMARPEYCSSAPERMKEMEQPLSFSSDDADIGLAWPDVPAVVTACHSMNLSDGPLLLGKLPSAAYCHDLLATATQAVRFAASWHLTAGDSSAPRIDTRK